MSARRSPRAPGIGDRWMSGERLPGVDFGLHDAVQVTEGTHAGRTGRVLLLAAPPPAPAYLVAVDGAGEVPVRLAQTALRASN